MRVRFPLPAPKNHLSGGDFLVAFAANAALLLLTDSTLILGVPAVFGFIPWVRASGFKEVNGHVDIRVGVEFASSLLPLRRGRFCSVENLEVAISRRNAVFYHAPLTFAGCNFIKKECIALWPHTLRIKIFFWCWREC